VPTTVLHGLRKPDLTYSPDGATQIGQLADDVDKILTVYSDTTPAHAPGLLWYAPTAKLLQISDGAAWHVLCAGAGATRSWSAALRAGSSDNFSASTRTQLQSVTFTGPAGTYRVDVSQSISTGATAAAGFLWITANGVDILDTARADTPGPGTRTLFSRSAPFVHPGGSATVAHSYQAAGTIGTVWNGPSTSLDVYWIGP
jgi:hypothetical protein